MKRATVWRYLFTTGISEQINPVFKLRLKQSDMCLTEITFSYNISNDQLSTHQISRLQKVFCKRLQYVVSEETESCYTTFLLDFNRFKNVQLIPFPFTTIRSRRNFSYHGMSNSTMLKISIIVFRTLPQKVGLAELAASLKLSSINALMVVGGFEVSLSIV